MADFTQISKLRYTYQSKTHIALTHLRNKAMTYLEHFNRIKQLQVLIFLRLILMKMD